MVDSLSVTSALQERSKGNSSQKHSLLVINFVNCSYMPFFLATSVNVIYSFRRSGLKKFHNCLTMVCLRDFEESCFRVVHGVRPAITQVTVRPIVHPSVWEVSRHYLENAWKNCLTGIVCTSLFWRHMDVTGNSTFHSTHCLWIRYLL